MRGAYGRHTLIVWVSSLFSLSLCVFELYCEYGLALVLLACRKLDAAVVAKVRWLVGCDWLLVTKRSV